MKQSGQKSKLCVTLIACIIRSSSAFGRVCLRSVVFGCVRLLVTPVGRYKDPLPLHVA